LRRRDLGPPSIDIRDLRALRRGVRLRTCAALQDVAATSGQLAGQRRPRRPQAPGGRQKGLGIEHRGAGRSPIGMPIHRRNEAHVRCGLSGTALRIPRSQAQSRGGRSRRARLPAADSKLPPAGSAHDGATGNGAFSLWLHWTQALLPSSRLPRLRNARLPSSAENLIPGRKSSPEK